MRSYKINIDKLINQLTPHYLGGRKIILFLQAVLHPLNTLSKKWTEWANITRMEAHMTSQVIMLEYYLHYKFNKYFVDPSERITISDGDSPGIPIYRESIDYKNMTVAIYNQSEKSKTNPAFHWHNEKMPTSEYSFTINCPKIDNRYISEKEMTAMISYAVKKYCLAGKKFTVIYKS